MKRRSASGYTLLEMMAVIAILSILLVLSVPSILILESTGLNASGREVGDFLNLCRSEAISQRTVIRFCIVVDSTNEEEKYRKYAAWIWDKNARKFQQHSKLHSLSTNVVFSENLPHKVRQSGYARNEPSSIRGDYIIDHKADSFEYVSSISGESVEGNSIEKRTLKFLEFSPSGRADIPWGEERNMIVAIRSSNVDIDETTNWVQFNVDSLTGRTRVYRP